MTLLTFLIPVRHQDNASDWQRLKANLAQTIESIAGQSAHDWRCVIVCNHGADLPPLPDRFEEVRVDFAPNDLHSLGSGPREAFLDAFRFDKGNRVMAGMLAARDSEYFMIVDDDDLVSANLVNYLRQNRGANGWKVTYGWIWNDGGSWLLKHDDFNHVCGTSLIVRSDLYGLPYDASDADRQFIMSFLGSHYSVDALFAERGTPLLPMPFRAAVYRVANPGSHSQTPGFLRKYVFTRPNLRRPWRVLRQIMRIRYLGRAKRTEFFGVKRA